MSKESSLTIIDAKIVSYDRFSDERGYFQLMENNTINSITKESELIKQSFVSFSNHGVLRGLHYQKKCTLSNLVTVLRGKIFDVGVDLRKKSSSFLEVNSIELNEENPIGIYWPPGVAHGFLSLGNENLIHYECFGEYNKNLEGGIHFLDKTLNISWPFKPTLVNSRDNKFKNLSEFSEKEFC